MNIHLNLNPDPTAPAPSNPFATKQPQPQFVKSHGHFCDVPGCTKSGHDFKDAFRLAQHKAMAHPQRHEPTVQAAPPTAPQPPKKYKCSQCDESFDHFGKLGRHTILKHPKPKSAPVSPGARPGQFKCKLCSKTYGSNATVRSHLIRDHQTTSTGNFTPIEERPPRKTNPGQYKCLLCGTTRATKKAVQMHIYNRHEGQGAKGNWQLLKESTAPTPDPIGTPTSRHSQFTCNICGNGYGSYSGAAQHIRNAHDASARGNWTRQTNSVAPQTPPPAATPAAPQRDAHHHGAAGQPIAIYGNASDLLNQARALLAAGFTTIVLKQTL